jgi:hypothetical protein
MLLQSSGDLGKCTAQRYKNNDADNSALCNYFALLSNAAI